MRKAANQRVAIEFLELVKLRSIHQSRNHFAGIIRLAYILRNEAVQFCRVIERLSGGLQAHRLRLGQVQCADN